MEYYFFLVRVWWWQNIVYECQKKSFFLLVSWNGDLQYWTDREGERVDANVCVCIIDFCQILWRRFFKIASKQFWNSFTSRNLVDRSHWAPASLFLHSILFRARYTILINSSLAIWISCIWWIAIVEDPAIVQKFNYLRNNCWRFFTNTQISNIFTPVVISYFVGQKEMKYQSINLFSWWRLTQEIAYNDGHVTTRAFQHL